MATLFRFNVTTFLFLWPSILSTTVQFLLREGSAGGMICSIALSCAPINRREIFASLGVGGLYWRRILRNGLVPTFMTRIVYISCLARRFRRRRLVTAACLGGIGCRDKGFRCFRVDMVALLLYIVRHAQYRGSGSYADHH